jgi:hypothetical protein
MMKLETSLRLILPASLLTIIIACLVAFGLITSIEFLGFSFFQIVCILSVAIIIEVPQTLGRALLLLFFEALRVREDKNVKVTVYPKVSVIVPRAQ